MSELLSPVEAVTYPDPYPYYASLVASRPFAYDQALGTWVAASAAAVGEVLAGPGLRVRPPAEPVPPGIRDTPAGAVFGDLVRMTDGQQAQRLKNVVTAALGQARPEQIAAIAADRAERVLTASDAISLQELMFGVPAQVVAALCGLDEDGGTLASRLIGEFVQCIPAAATPAQQAAAARAAASLQDLLGPELTDSGHGLLAELVHAAARDDWAERAPLLANGIGFLSQTYDATAGLIGNSLLAIGRQDVPALASAAGLEPFVTEVARHDAAVQNTRRFAAEPAWLAGSEVAPGDAILVVLAAANRDPQANPDPDAFRADRASPALFTFGAGGHRCPGQVIAVTIAAAVIAALIRHGWDASHLPGGITYRPLSNARIPVL